MDKHCSRGQGVGELTMVDVDVEDGDATHVFPSQVAGIYMTSAWISASDTCALMRPSDGRGLLVWKCQTVYSGLVTRTKFLDKTAFAVCKRINVFGQWWLEE